ncbi:MAG: hypothetical protein R6U19_04345, partial [Bacteroidales bacterium]
MKRLRIKITVIIVGLLMSFAPMEAQVWDQIGGAIEGEAGDRFGSSTSISGNGSIVASGGPVNVPFASGAGHVRIFENSTVSSEPLQQQGISLYPNPTDGILHFEVENAST